MEKLKELETLRSKDEFINYFKQNDIDITEEEILDLKKQYDNFGSDGNCLSMQQLNEVAGGICEHSVNRSAKFAIACTLFTLVTLGIGLGVKYLSNK